MKLRDYQHQALRAIESAHDSGTRSVVVAHATGLGKTVVAAAWLARHATPDGRALVLAHREELLQQAREQLGRWVDPRAVGLVRADCDESDRPIVVASVPTLARSARLQRFLNAGPPIRWLVQDEMHHAAADTYQDIFAELGVDTPTGPLVVGLSATPHRHDGKRLPWPIVHEIRLSEGIAQGYLSDIEVRRCSLDGDWHAQIRRGDYLESDLAQSYLNGGGPDLVAESLVAQAEGRPSLVFTPTVETAELTAEKCRALGLTAQAVHGTLPLPLRVSILSAFGDGACQVVTNCAVLTEGFDAPHIGCLVLARPTRSRGLFLQMLGRGTRKHPTKDRLLVLDVVGATDLHGLVTVESVTDVDDELEEGESITEAWARQEHTRDVERAIVAEWKARPYAWVPTTVGYALGLGSDHGTLLLRQTSAGHMLYQLQRGRPHTFVGHALDLEDGQQMAEELARTLRVDKLARKDEGWRMARASIGQRNAMEKFRLPTPDSLTRGQAADAITRAIVELSWRR